VKTEDFIVHKRPRLFEVRKSPKISMVTFERRLRSLQNMLQLVQQAYLGSVERGVVVLEGWDTAGKGGVVRRLAWALDPRSFKVHPIAAPSAREKAQHYLQRFWEKLPQQGEIVVFDRSWYGRVLVERVEQLATPQEWKRAYREINDFERAMVADGVRLVKIFLHITPEEQVRRFKDRFNTPRKRWKLTYEDFRNRDRWKEYEVAIEDMMGKTSTKHSRWYLVPANNKSFARLAALSILADQLGKGVSLEPRPLDAKTAMAASQLLVSPRQPDSSLLSKSILKRKSRSTAQRDRGQFLTSNQR
jgi:AMP-polyphosphate phosphotransferase